MSKPELRNPDGTFVRGVSPNPGGQSKKLRRVRKALERLDTPALERLAQLIASDDPKVAVVALGIWAKYRLPVPKEGKDDDKPTTGPRLGVSHDVLRALSKAKVQ
jgi:hypothetical protein